MTRKLALAFLASTLTSSALAQQEIATPHPAQVTFEFEHSGVEVPRFTLQLDEDGSAKYEADAVLPSPRGSDPENTPATEHVERQITLSAATTRKIFASARELNRFNYSCASKAKNIADTGKKTLRYAGQGGEGTCLYNYSQDRRVLMLTDAFEGISETLGAGRKLDFDHRFDRLGLDAAMTNLVQAVDAGRAIELGTIAATLRSLAQDSEVLERVRSRAAKLLLQVEQGS